MQPQPQQQRVATDSLEPIESLSTDKLQALAGTLDSQIVQLLSSTWGNMAKAQALQHQKLLERVQRELNRRHGSDGMTPLN